MAPLTWPTLPAWNLTPFAVIDPSPTLVTLLTLRPLWTDSQRAGRGGVGVDLNFEDCVLKRGGAFRSYLCNAVSTSLIISLISMTRLPDGLERRSSSCLNWLRQWTWCCNYRGDWRQRLPLLIKYSCFPHDDTVVGGRWLPPFASNTFKTFSESLHKDSKEFNTGCSMWAACQLYLNSHSTGITFVPHRIASST